MPVPNGLDRLLTLCMLCNVVIRFGGWKNHVHGLLGIKHDG